MKILVIDDDQDYQDHFSDTLTELGAKRISLDFVSDPMIALHAVNGMKKWDHYFVDWRFIGSTVTGSQIVRQIFRAHPDARVALCTGYDPITMEKELLDEVSNGRVTLLKKFGAERQYLTRLIGAKSKDQIRVMVLDDDIDDAASISQTLSHISEGRIKPDITNSTKEAFQRLSEVTYDGFVLDYNLQDPAETGIDFYKSLPEHQRNAPTALVTGVPNLALDLDTLELIANGHLRFISKFRVSPGRLSACFESALN